MFLLLIFATACLAGVIHTLTGFGAAIVLMLVMPMFYSMTAAPAISSGCTVFMSYALAWRYRKLANPRQFIPPAICSLTFSILSIRVAGHMDLTVLKVSFSIFLIVLAFYLLFLSGKLEVRPTLSNMAVCCIISGICAGLFGVGGPLMALYFLATTRSKEEYAGTIQSYFSITATVNLLTRVQSGILTVDMIPILLLCAAGNLVGRAFGQKIFDRIDRERLKKGVYTFIAVAGAINLFETLL